jgi:hypothetical protein
MPCPGCKTRHREYKEKQGRKKFPGHKPRPACKCVPLTAKWLSKYNKKLPVHVFKSFVFGKIKVRPGDNSPVPGSGGGGTNRLGHYVSSINPNGSKGIQQNSDGTPKVETGFDITPDTPLYGGDFNERGRIVGGRVSINYGHKRMKEGVDYIYAFAACIAVPPDVLAGIPPKDRLGCPPGSYRASGWIPIDAVTGEYKSVVEQMREVPIEEPAPAYRGGNNYEGCVINRRISTSQLKVKHCTPRTAREQKTDYLVRPGDVVNLLQSTPQRGGVARDTFPVGTVFWRLKEDKIPKPIEVPLYRPCGSTPVGYMKFVYGFVGDPNDPGNRRYGWIAAEVLCCMKLSSPALPQTAKADGEFKSEVFAVIEGKRPYTFAPVGELPEGLNITRRGGELSGKPSAKAVRPEAYKFKVRATDSRGCAAESKEYSIRITCPTITLRPSTLPKGGVGKPYSQTLRASGGVAPYSFAKTGGNASDEIQIEPSTGAIVGTSNRRGEFGLEVTVTDSKGCTARKGFVLKFV